MASVRRPQWTRALFDVVESESHIMDLQRPHYGVLSCEYGANFLSGSWNLSKAVKIKFHLRGPTYRSKNFGEECGEQRLHFYYAWRLTPPFTSLAPNVYSLMPQFVTVWARRRNATYECRKQLRLAGNPAFITRREIILKLGQLGKEVEVCG